MIDRMVQCANWDPIVDELSSSRELIWDVLMLSSKCCGGSSDDDDDDDGNAMNKVEDSGRSNLVSIQESIFTRHILLRIIKSFESSRWNVMENVDRSVALYEIVLKFAEEISSLSSALGGDGKIQRSK